jgi:hypothetical protein
MTQKAFFEMLGAPLVNARWSWGAVRKADGAILLRVWQDNVRTYENREFVCILRGTSNRASPRTHGGRERLKHARQICGGAPCYLIMCEAEDVAARPRRVRRFNSEEVFPGGSVREIDGDTCVELLSGVSVEEFVSSKAGRRRRRVKRVRAAKIRR